MTRESHSAVEVHSEQASIFAARYGETDPYASCFPTAGRGSTSGLDEWLDEWLLAQVNRAALALPVRRLTRVRQFFVTTGRVERMFGAADFPHAEAHGVALGPDNWVERAPRRR